MDVLVIGINFKLSGDSFKANLTGVFFTIVFYYYLLLSFVMAI